MQKRKILYTCPHPNSRLIHSQLTLAALGSHLASISTFRQSGWPLYDALWAAVQPSCNSAHKRKWLIEEFKLRVISWVVRSKGDARMESHADVQLGPRAFNLILCATGERRCADKRYTHSNTAPPNNHYIIAVV